MKTFILRYILNASLRETRFDAVNYIHALHIAEAILTGMGGDNGFAMIEDGQQVRYIAEFVSLTRANLV